MEVRLLVSAVCLFALHCRVTAVTDKCNISAVPRQELNLDKFAGTWYEIKYYSAQDDVSDAYDDYSETYTRDAADQKIMRIKYAYREPNNPDCTVVNSNRFFYYIGSGEFILSKFYKNNTYLVSYIDDQYSVAIIVICPLVLPNGLCNETLDVWYMYRLNQDYAPGVLDFLDNFVTENLPCIDLRLLYKTKHTSSCVDNNSSATTHGSSLWLMSAAFIVLWTYMSR